MKMAEPYQRDMDFAFFVAEFGYSWRDYQDLTLRQIAFIKKEWENKIVRDSSLQHKTIVTAYYNANRGRKRFRDLWKKSTHGRRVDPKETAALFEEVRAAEDKKGTGWIDKILGRKKGDTR